MNERQSVSPNRWTVIHGIHGDKYIYEINRDSFRSEAATTIFNAQYKESLKAPDTLYIIIGTDSGLLPNYVYNKGAPPVGSHYVFVETPEIIAALQDNRLPLPDHDAIHLVTLEELDERLKQIDMERYIYTERLKVRRSLAALDGHIPDYTHLWVEVDAYIHEQETLVAPLLVTRQFIDLEFDNLAENIQPASALANAFEGYTAVILAGGSSLDQGLEWIRSHREKLLLIAVSRISRQLIEAGITPDIIVGIDPNPAMFDVSREMLKMPVGDTPVFLHASYVNRRLLKQWPGKSLFMGLRVRWKGDDHEANISVTPPTVTNAAVTAAIVMRCASIVLCGVDLCYSQEGYTHAEGSIERKSGPNLHEITVTVETNSGAAAQTNNIYRQAATVLANQAQVANELGINVVNIAAEAMHIPGIEHRPLGELALPSPEASPTARLNSLVPELSREARIQHYIKSLSDLLTLKEGIAHIRSLAKKALEYNRMLYADDGSVRNFKYKKKLDGIESKIDEKGNITRFVKMYGIRDFLRTVRPKDKAWSHKEARDWTNRYYQAYLDACERIRERIDQTQTDMEVHLEEEQAAPDFNLISGRLLTTGTPGHIYRIRRLNPEGHQRIVETYPDQYRNLEQQFEAQFTNSALQKAKHFVNTDSSKILYRIRWLFSKADAGELLALADQLQTYQGEQNVMLSHLARAFALQLNGDHHTALQEYQQVTAGEGLEDALVQMSGLLIELGDNSNATLALECLTHLSPIYMPQYAELLYLTGDVRTALDEYAKYFDIIPDDIRTLSKLAGIYEKHDAKDAAVMLYKHILSLDPDNPAAKERLSSIEP